MRWLRRLAAVLVVTAAALALNGREASTQSLQFEYFPETGHSLEGAFLDFYRSHANPEFIYGYPVTEAFVNVEGLLVQYFQRARLEQSSEGAIMQTPLGRLMYPSGNPRVSYVSNTGACQAFAGGQRVCTSFLEFFNAHGGLAQFGRPISGVELQSDRYVQYFENARMEWHPEAATTGLEIRLGYLGRLYFERLGEDPAFLRPIDSSPILEVTSLRAHVFSEFAAVQQNQSQRLYVVLQDQNYRPIENASFDLVVLLPNGSKMEFSGATNDAGFGEIELFLGQADTGTGLALIDLSAEMQGLTSQSSSSFRIGR